MRPEKWWILCSVILLFVAAACTGPASSGRTAAPRTPLLDSEIPQHLETAAFALG
jgi:hypothetical protein